MRGGGGKFSPTRFARGGGGTWGESLPMNTAAKPVAVLFTGLLLAAPLPAAAQVCETLAKVVNAAGENPPFNSVRYFDLPNATCSVGSYYQFDHAWQCELRLELGSKKAELEQLERELDNLYDMRKDLDDEDDDLSDERMDLFDDYYYGIISNEEYKRRLAPIEARRDLIGKELSRIGDWGEGGEIGALEQRKEDIEVETNREMSGQVRKLLSAIQQCTFDGKLPGTWGNFEDYEFENDYDWSFSSICTTNNDWRCIELKKAYEGNYAHVGWKAFVVVKRPN